MKTFHLQHCPINDNLNPRIKPSLSRLGQMQRYTRMSGFFTIYSLCKNKRTRTLGNQPHCLLTDIRQTATLYTDRTLDKQPRRTLTEH